MEEDMDIKEILQQVAITHGVTAEKVEADINYALHAAMQSKGAKEHWERIAQGNTEPSIEAVIHYCADFINDLSLCSQEQRKKTNTGRCISLLQRYERHDT